MTARILGILVTCYLLLVTLVTPAFAQASTPSAIPNAVLPTSPIYTDMLVHNMFHTFSCLAVGQSVIGQPCLTYQLQKNAQGAIQGVPVLSQVNLSGGTLGAVTGVIGALYQNPPVRTYESLASLGQTLGIVKEAHAQVIGSGAGVLQPIQTLWQVSRNISYVIMIIIFVVIGLMVMFRQRINPQTVITAQAAIPGLVIGLILITFSYFLAGLISDTAFIGTNLVGAYFSAVKGKPNEPQNLVQEISPHSAFFIMGKALDSFEKGQFSNAVEIILNALKDGPAYGLVKGAAALLAYQYGSFVGPAVGAVLAGGACLAFPTATIPGVGIALGAIGAPLCAAIGQAFGPILTGGAAATAVTVAPGPVIGIALWVIFVVIIIYTMFRLVLRLVNSFLSIIFLVIIAPFHFLIASLPGRQNLATDWFLNLLSNVLAFPAVLAVFYFIAFILGKDIGPLTVSDANQIQNSTFISSALAADKIQIVDSATFPLLGGIDLNFIRILLAFGALVATPAIPDIVQRSIGKVSQAGQLIGQEISGGARSGREQFAQAQARFGGIGSNVQQAIEKYRGPWAPGLKPRFADQEAAERKRLAGLKKI